MVLRIFPSLFVRRRYCDFRSYNGVSKIARGRDGTTSMSPFG